jgi:hypothetical protein
LGGGLVEDQGPTTADVLRDLVLDGSQPFTQLSNVIARGGHGYALLM